MWIYLVYSRKQIKPSGGIWVWRKCWIWHYDPTNWLGSPRSPSFMIDSPKIHHRWAGRTHQVHIAHVYTVELWKSTYRRGLLGKFYISYHQRNITRPSRSSDELLSYRFWHRPNCHIYLTYVTEVVRCVKEPPVHPPPPATSQIAKNMLVSFWEKSYFKGNVWELSSFYKLCDVMLLLGNSISFYYFFFSIFFTVNF